MKLPGLTDMEIWNLFKKGDNQALSLIYAAQAKKLYQYGLKITTNSRLVEDAIHDVFATLIRNRKRLGDTDNIFFYLLTSFRRLLIRKMEKEKRFTGEEKLNETQFNVVWSAEHQFIHDETTRQKTAIMVKALQQLTARQKEALYLRFNRELDYAEIAQLMEISVEACRNLISAAVKSLKGTVGDEKGNSLVMLCFCFRHIDEPIK